jgi:hypothetical protein
VLATSLVLDQHATTRTQPMRGHLHLQRHLSTLLLHHESLHAQICIEFLGEDALPVATIHIRIPLPLAETQKAKSSYLALPISTVHLMTVLVIETSRPLATGTLLSIPSNPVLAKSLGELPILISGKNAYRFTIGVAPLPRTVVMRTQYLVVFLGDGCSDEVDDGAAADHVTAWHSCCSSLESELILVVLVVAYCSHLTQGQLLLNHQIVDQQHIAQSFHVGNGPSAYSQHHLLGLQTPADSLVEKFLELAACERRVDVESDHLSSDKLECYFIDTQRDVLLLTPRQRHSSDKRYDCCSLTHINSLLNTFWIIGIRSSRAGRSIPDEFCQSTHSHK